MFAATMQCCGMKNIHPIYLHREKCGLSLAALAARTGVDSGNLSRIERGLQIPSYRTAKRIAKCLDVSVSEIIESKQIA